MPLKSEELKTRWKNNKLDWTELIVIDQGLHKKYGSAGKKKRLCCLKKEPEKTKAAINSLSFAVEAGEVFGLLGHLTLFQFLIPAFETLLQRLIVSWFLISVRLLKLLYFQSTMISKEVPGSILDTS